MTESRSKSERNEPLMYIVQPKIQEMSRSMQYYFHSNQEQQPQQQQATKALKQEVEKQAPVKEAMPEKKVEPSFALIESVPAGEKKKEEQKGPNKMFQHMSVEEKANFLLQFPKHMSQPVCDVETKNQTYRGTIVQMTQDMMYIIIPPHAEKTEIALKDIKQLSIVKI
ncbi:CotO family spore coat protein [Priestia koreensis]|uniref:CotO family spore coat protein n=1 Tax=Priestia koreensis TaxID=284581 RepID=UPI00345754D0